MPILQVVSCYRNPRLGAAVTVRLSRCTPPTCSGGRYSICFPTEERCRILHKETCFPFFPFCTRGRLSTVTPHIFCSWPMFCFPTGWKQKPSSAASSPCSYARQTAVQTEASCREKRATSHDKQWRREAGGGIRLVRAILASSAGMQTL